MNWKDKFNEAVAIRLQLLEEDLYETRDERDYEAQRANEMRDDLQRCISALIRITDAAPDAALGIAGETLNALTCAGKAKQNADD